MKTFKQHLNEVKYSEPFGSAHAAHIKKLRAQFDRNEDNNNHHGNTVLLTKHFGTPEEHETAKKHLATRNKLGHASTEGSQFGYEMNKKYFHKLSEETVNEVTEGQPGEHKASPYKYVGKKDGYHVFDDGSGKKEAFGKRSTPPASWHLKHNGSYYEFAHSLKEDVQLDEVITKATPAGEVVDDFVHSKNKMFKGDSKKQRIRRALGAYYAKKNESVDEARRLIAHHANPENGRSAKVYRDAEWGEYRVKHFSNGEHHKEADYHTDDKGDAHDTAKHWVNSDMIPSKHIAHTMGEAYEHSYSRTAVDKAIKSSRQKIGGREAKMIHRLLKGRQVSNEPPGYDNETGKFKDAAATANPKHFAKEEVVNELSKKTLGSYIKGAAKNIDDKAWNLSQVKNAHIINKRESEIATRHKGIKRAVSKLTKEETLAEEMSHAAHELVLHADNDSHLYHSSHEPIVKNLKKKVKSGKYDPEKAKKLWGYHADRAAQSYHKQHGDKSQPWHKMFSTSDRKQAAAHWEANQRSELHENIARD